MSKRVKTGMAFLVVAGVLTAWAARSIASGIRKTQVIHAVSCGTAATVDRLLSRSPGLVNLRSSEPEYMNPTLLHLALYRGDTGIAKVLVSHGADVKATDNANGTPLYYAVPLHDRELVELMLAKGADPLMEYKYGGTALSEAADSGDKAMAVSLLRHSSRKTWTMHEAAALSEVAIVRGMLSADPKLVSARDVKRETPLHKAALTGSDEMIRLLLGAGARIGAGDEYRRTALHFAARQGHASTCALLIAKGAGVGSRDDHKDTPLHFAAEGANLAVVRVLLDSGADANAIGLAGLTPLHKTAFGEEYWRNAKATDHERALVADMLLSRGANVDGSRASPCTPLHYAAIWGNTAVARVLIDHGADPYAKNGNGETPLAAAIRCKRNEVVRLLKARGVSH